LVAKKQKGVDGFQYHELAKYCYLSGNANKNRESLNSKSELIKPGMKNNKYATEERFPKIQKTAPVKQVNKELLLNQYRERKERVAKGTR